MDLTELVGGHTRGTVRNETGTVAIVFKSLPGIRGPVRFAFPHRDYDGSEHAAECAARAFQYVMCVEQGLIKNQYRIATDRDTGDRWIQMNVVRHGITMVAVMDIDIIKSAEERVWGVDDEGYVVSRSKHGRHIKLHRLVLPGHPIIDHIDGDRLNNRKSNLRPATYLTNARNKKLHKNNKTGYSGVSKPKGKKRYRVRWEDEYGKPRNKSFSYSKFKDGKRGAFAAAIAFRQTIDKEFGITTRIPAGYKRTRDPDSSDDEEPPAKRARVLTYTECPDYRFLFIHQ